MKGYPVENLGDAGIVDDGGDIHVHDDATNGVPRDNAYRIARMHPHQEIPEDEALPAPKEASADIGKIAAGSAALSEEAYDEAAEGVAGFVDALTTEQRQMILDIVDHFEATHAADANSNRRGLKHAARQSYKSAASRENHAAEALIETLTGVSRDKEDDSFPTFLWWKNFIKNNRASLKAAIHATAETTAGDVSDDETAAAKEKERLDDLGVTRW